MMFSMSYPPAAVSVRSMEADGIPTIFNRVPNETLKLPVEPPSPWIKNSVLISRE